ncbi:hypothetical protein [Aestuariivirga sp.]|uniref:hypothetical protein n=1 Tax=Aestuariivirga sp. TaxID=2650926 RepID=UPI0039E4F01D
MDLKINNISGHGDASEEYVYLTVENDCDVGKYMLADSTYTQDDKISNKLRHVYWFPDKKVKKGDAVVLRTGKGKNASEPLDGGGTKHRFYWNLDSAIWNDDGDAAVLLHVDDWTQKKAK